MALSGRANSVYQLRLEKQKSVEASKMEKGREGQGLRAWAVSGELEALVPVLAGDPLKAQTGNNGSGCLNENNSAQCVGRS